VWGVCVGGGGGGGVVGGGFPLRSNIPRSALCATLDTYNLLYNGLKMITTIWSFKSWTKTPP
jgi:hypothetical protein